MQKQLARIIDEEAAALIASEFKGDYTKLYCKEKEELMEIEGIDEATADKIRAVVEFSEDLYTKQAKKDAIKLHNEETISNYVMAKLSHKQQEYFMVVVLDSELRVIGEEIVAKGSGTEMSLEPKDLFRKAIKIGGKYVILAHNHPSGDVRASKNDILTTQRLAKVGLFLGIRVADHIIVGNGEYSSMTYANELNLEKVLKATQDITF